MAWNAPVIDGSTSPASTTVSGVVTIGTDGESTAGEVVSSTDSRLSDARTPTAHQSSHRVGGSDALPTGDASTPGLLKLGASGGALGYDATTAYTRSLLDDADAATACATLALVVGTNVQAWDVDLDGYAALSTTGLVIRTGSGTAATRTLAAGSGQVTVSNGDGVSGNPTVDLAYASAVRTTSGPTTLTMGAVTDGEYLKRVGSMIVSAPLALALALVTLDDAG